MSYEIGHDKVHGGFDTKPAIDGIFKLLPNDCSTPGYWTSLAENSNDWAHEISACHFWRDANAALPRWKKEYRRDHGGALGLGDGLPSFVGKSAQRIREKTIEKVRRAEDLNHGVREIFDQEVAIPRLEDLVRVRLQVHFLDGVPYLARKIHELVKKYDPRAKIEPKGSLNGYFAQHLTFCWPVYFRFGGDPTSCKVTCEVQIATSLATHVWTNSHGLYEATRIDFEKSEDWQWSPKDPRFLARQLGHMIHLADGLFCNLRDNSLGSNASAPKRDKDNL